MKKTLLFLATVLMSLSMMAQTTTYTKINSESELNAGDKVLLVGIKDDGSAFAMSWQKSNNRGAVAVTNEGGSITTAVAVDPNSQTDPFELTVGGQSGAWTFFDEVTNGYLYAPGGGNYLRTQGTNNANGEWVLAVDQDGFKPTSNGSVDQKYMHYNAGSTLFGCYNESSTVTGVVYIFKGGEPSIDPEPSNYPTNFNATLSITKATLTWTASTGAQLPRGYVVLGTTGSINAPVDGSPVENDVDPSDGNVAFNTTGTTVSFDQLPANTTWTFAIFPYTNSGANIDYKTDGSYPTATVTTQDVTCIFASDFASGLTPFIAISLEGDQEWTTGSYDGIPYAKMSGYASGTNYANEDWLITPDILDGNQYDELTVSFMNAYKFDGNPLELKISTEYDGMSDPSEFDWVDVTAFCEWSQGEYEWVTTDFDIETAGMSHLYIAFRFTSTDAASSTWEVAEFRVYEGYDAVMENEAVSFNLYPNPASSSINIEAESAAEVQIMDMAGRTVMTVNAVEGVNTINVADLANGVYFVRMNGAVVKFVKR